MVQRGERRLKRKKWHFCEPPHKGFFEVRKIVAVVVVVVEEGEEKSEQIVRGEVSKSSMIKPCV